MTVVPTAAALRVRRRARPGRRCPASRSPPRSGTTSTRCRTCGSARRPTSSWSPRRPPTCWPRPPTAWPTTCSPTPCSPPAARSCSRPRCTPRCGSTRPPQANVATLRERGAVVIEPAEGRLTGADTGKGRLPEPGRDLRASAATCSAPRRRPCPTWPAGTSSCRAGGTREYLDPVRFLGNRSSGRQGYALARAAAARGAEVTLVAANVRAARPGRRQGRARSRPPPSCATPSSRRAASADAVVMAAAPADFRPVAVSEAKIKKADDGSAPGHRARRRTPTSSREISPRPAPRRDR